MKPNYIRTAFLISSLILIACLITQGPTRISDKPNVGHIANGSPITRKANFAAERNFVYYKVQSGQTPLQHTAVERLARKFGISSDALYNANNQRGKSSLDIDSLNRVRIPL